MSDNLTDDEIDDLDAFDSEPGYKPTPGEVPYAELEAIAREAALDEEFAELEEIAETATPDVLQALIAELDS